MKLFLFCGTVILILLVGGTIIRHRAAARKFNKAQEPIYVDTLLVEIICEKPENTQGYISIVDFSRFEDQGIAALQAFFFKKNYERILRSMGLQPIEGEDRTLLLVQDVLMWQHCLPNGKTVIWKWRPVDNENSKKD